MAKVFSSIVKDQIINHHPEMLIFQGGLIRLLLKASCAFRPEKAAQRA